ncbi:MAG: hypothetical protein IBJ12_16305 [Sphingomonadaceae bacterium]|nr:hypothetical protein [Sphingomonadaceae bacterium]
MSTFYGNDTQSSATEARGTDEDMCARSVSDLPDRGCFGLSHPYIQRLIFLAGDAERGPLPAN